MQVDQKFVTAARPSAVWRILADVEHWPDWTPTVVEIKPLSGSGLMVGARYRVVQPKLRPAVYEVTECIPNKTFTWVQKLPGGTLVADHRLSPRGDATEVELSFTSEGLLANIIGKMFSVVISDYVATEAKSLKSRCDSLAAQEEDCRDHEEDI
jgi:hypothetical protein